MRTINLSNKDILSLERYLDNQKILIEQMLKHGTIDKYEYDAELFELMRIERLLFGVPESANKN